MFSRWKVERKTTKGTKDTKETRDEESGIRGAAGHGFFPSAATLAFES
jgi:hypothetical protein